VEEYSPELLEPLAALVRRGISDVEIHLHHESDTAQHFMDVMETHVRALHNEHGLLRRHEDRLAFGFIHGNWALDNSRPDGRWCGLNNEITLLNKLGCYADFTLPSVPDVTQAGPVNVIYRATDNPAEPRSHERGIPVRPGSSTAGHLTIVPGPLVLAWDRPKRRVRIDTGEVSTTSRFCDARVGWWLEAAPRIGDHVFIKLFTHGAQERNAALLLGGELDNLYDEFARRSEGQGFSLHFVSAWEMAQAIDALRERRDPLLLLNPPPAARPSAQRGPSV
jgi:hypothetical protein